MFFTLPQQEILMAKEIKTIIEINASPKKIWAVLIDFDRYGEWNPFILSIQGEARSGEQLKAVIQPPGGKGMTFRPVILALQPEQELRWMGKVLLPGIFDGEHQFKIEPMGEHRTQLIHREVFSGLLVPLLWQSLNINTRKGFEAMNQALKKRVES
jgi:hypothetical protein